MHSPLSARLRYLHDCRQADGSSRSVADIFGETRFPVLVAQGEDATLTGLLDRVPLLNGEVADEVLRLATVYGRERTLMAGAFVLVGKFAGRSYGAPLLMAPATLRIDTIAGGGTGHFVEVDAADLELQVEVLAEILGLPEREVWEEVRDWPQAPFDKAGVHALLTALSARLPQVDVSGMRAWPALCGEDALRTARSKKGLRCLPAWTVALVPNSMRARGVLFELDQMASDSVSPAVAAVLGSDGGTQAPEGRRGPAPWIPSEEQARAVEVSAQATVTTIVGPPGTGKSTTLAGLALSAVGGGQSVVIAARTPAALDAVQERLDALIGAPCPTFRVGRGGVRRDLIEQLDALCRGALPFTDVAQFEMSDAEQRVSRAQRRLGGVVKTLTVTAAWEQALADGERAWSVFDGLRVAWLRRQLRRAGPPWHVVAEHEAALDAWEEAARVWVKVWIRDRLQQARQSRLSDLRKLVAAVRARTSSRRAACLHGVDVPSLLRLLPLWLTDLDSAHLALPMQPALFDLAIIDEATHIDPASALPILHRARRVVVTGDPKQLRHVSFLAGAKQQAFANAHQLDADAQSHLAYRSRSLLDLASSTTQVHASVRLREHFRSRPHLIAFSNKAFYDGQLAVMTARPGRSSEASVHVHTVHGARGSDGVNRAEVDALVAHLAERVARGDRASLGVISPLRDQVEALREAIAASLSTVDVDRHRLVVDTPYGFQGLERDEVWLSFAVDADAPAASWRYLDRADVFNVAVTRARTAQHVFVSVVPTALPPKRLLRQYLELATSWTASSSGPAPVRDRWLAAVVTRLQAEGFACSPSFEVAGLTVDLVVEQDGVAVAVDLIGEPGGLGEPLSPVRTRLLHRAGLPVVPLPLSWWEREPDACVAAVVAAWRVGRA